MMIAVLYAAVGCAFVASFVRAAGRTPEASVGGAILLGSIATLMVWGVLTLLLVRQGPLRDWLVTLFWASALAVPVALMIAGLLSAAWENILVFGVELPGGSALILAGLLAYFLALIIRRVIWYRCPACRRRRLLRDTRDATEAAVPRRNREFLPAYRCLSCDRLFLRASRAWRSIDDPMPEPAPISS
jgi:hypothetical protein